MKKKLIEVAIGAGYLAALPGLLVMIAGFRLVTGTHRVKRRKR